MNDSLNNIIKTNITTLINNTFLKLNAEHKNILIKYLFKVVVMFTVYFASNNIIKQLNMNKSQDIYSLLVLLLPYYDLNKSMHIKSLNEIIRPDLDSQKTNNLSSYFIDHKNLFIINDYFDNVLKSIVSTFQQTSNKLMVNWTNIFPYTLSNYNKSTLYDNYIKIHTDKTYQTSGGINLDNLTTNNFFILGNDTLYGTIYNFMYNDIKSIKWMIYDFNFKNINILPMITIIGNELKINNIQNITWEYIPTDQQLIIVNNWNNFINNSSFKLIKKTLILFYLRWETNKTNLPKISKKYTKEINLISSDYIFDDDNEDNFIYSNSNEDNLTKCIHHIANNIKFEHIYNYIYQCMQQFRYTWYGHMILNDQHQILKPNNFYDKYLVDDKQDYMYYITPKNIYNYFKSLLHYTINSEYVLLSNNFKWDNLDIKSQEIIIQRLNHNSIVCDWFSIKTNLQRIYPLANNQLITDIHNNINRKLFLTTLIPNIILKTLVVNGILTYFKYNSILTDKNKIPDKNINFKGWENHILTNIKIQLEDKEHLNAYHFLSNKQFTMHDEKYNEITIDSKWYNNFAANWIAQIQIFHRQINKRVIFITGATGVGKSTTAPLMMLYGLKILFYNNNGKIYCTQPRIQPTESNAEHVAKSLGYLMKKDLTKEDLNICNDINYIQYKYSDPKLTGESSTNDNLTDDSSVVEHRYEIIDDNYHPCLRFYTDGSFYSTLQNNYLLKHNDGDGNPQTNNLCDILLVDEAHEHNTYMDLILTLGKYATYINNQITLGIVSATMDEDEKIYRKYFKVINDNWKAPLKIISDKNSHIDYDSNIIDRRIHLSIPFGGKNFKVDEYVNAVNNVLNITQVNQKVEEILMHILKTSTTGDILIFQSGEADIKKFIKNINSKIPPNVLAVPFYSKLDKNILNNVKNIANNEFRNNFRNPKNYDIDDEVPKNELKPVNYYKRFIIIATNIAEASITINTLVYVIDTGIKKINVYDPLLDQSKLTITKIAKSNCLQRIGRTGRTKPGFVYFTYNPLILPDKVTYNICIEDITEYIIKLTTSKFVYLINKANDPFLVEISLVPQFLQNQYSIKKFNFDKIQTYSRKTNTDESIIYPYIDGKYDVQTLFDDNGKFYIIHPDEDIITRNIDLDIIDTGLNYVNKVKNIINNLQKNNFIDKFNNITQYGENVRKISTDLIIKLKEAKIIYDLISLNIPFDSLLFRNILLFIIFSNTTNKLYLKHFSLTGNADFLIQSMLIPQDIFTIIDNEIFTSTQNLSTNKIKRKNIKDIIKENLDLKINNEIIKTKRSTIDDIFKQYYKFKNLLTIDYFNKNILPLNYNNNLKNKINLLNEYEKLCLLIVINNPTNIFKKVHSAPLYINYLNKDVNYVCRLKSNEVNNKIYYDTAVSSKLINNYIYGASIDDLLISNIFWVPQNVILLVQQYLISINYNIQQKNTKLDKLFVNSIYEKIDYNSIYTNIHYIIDTILEKN